MFKKKKKKTIFFNYSSINTKILQKVEFEKTEVYIHEKPVEEDINDLLIEPEKIDGRLQIVKNVI